jgi:hypothetical protein
MWEPHRVIQVEGLIASVRRGQLVLGFRFEVAGIMPFVQLT